MPLAKKAEEQLNLPDTYKVFAADLSLKRPGFCIVTMYKGNVEAVETASIDNKAAKKCRSEILKEIYDFLAGRIVSASVCPAYFVREHAFNSRGAMSEIGIFEVVGIADLALWEKAKQEWREIYPVSVKKLVTGSGKADKQQVADCVKKVFGQTEFRNDDESDAAAVALAWLIQNDQVKVEDEANEEERL
jgi:crossover junction endodeoxyribonuclease RuvC